MKKNLKIWNLMNLYRSIYRSFLKSSNTQTKKKKKKKHVTSMSVFIYLVPNDRIVIIMNKLKCQIHE